MNTWSFEIDGPLKPFLATHVAPWKEAAKKYVAFKRRVRLLANVAGIPSELKATDIAELHISVHWVKKAHCDCINLQKSIEDGLFHQDRRVMIGSYRALENTGEEKAFVVVTVG